MKRLKLGVFLLCTVLVASTLFGCMQQVDFKVSFMTDDNTVYHVLNTSGNEVVKIPADPVKEGYRF